MPDYLMEKKKLMEKKTASNHLKGYSVRVTLDEKKFKYNTNFCNDQISR